MTYAKTPFATDYPEKPKSVIRPQPFSEDSEMTPVTLTIDE